MFKFTIVKEASYDGPVAGTVVYEVHNLKITISGFMCLYAGGYYEELVLKDCQALAAEYVEEHKLNSDELSYVKDHLVAALFMVYIGNNWSDPTIDSVEIIAQ